MTQLRVSGMSCGGCVKSVTKIIARTTSVDEDQVSVSLEDGRASFPDGSEEAVQTVLEKLEAAGFPSEVEPGRD